MLDSYRWPTWRSNFGRIANIAIGTCRPIRGMRGSAPTSAHSAPIASRGRSRTSAPIAAAASRLDPSGRRGNGDPNCPWRSARPRRSGSNSPTAAKRSRPSFAKSRAFRPTNA